jgi:CRISPR/Cas system-associated exonuclease Cas4 (RecB family)
MSKTIPYPWSPSKLSCYEQCPRQAKYKFIEKRPDPGSAAMQRGNEIHNKLEEYVRGIDEVFPTEAKKVKSLVNKLRTEYKKKRVRVELKVGFDKNWGKLKDWMDPDCWLRMKIDVLHLESAAATKVIDWKTGRFKPEDPAYNDQLNIYATAALSLGFGTRTTASLVFTDCGEEVIRDAGTLNRGQLPVVQASWEKRIKKMFADTKHPPRPGRYCKWCPFSQNDGGPCEF